jgi:SAM-dependent methyltransferase
MDITDIPLDDGSFDMIVCSHVLEHVPDDRKAMRELFRVLRPGGWAVLQSPLDPARPHTYEDWSITAPQERQRAFGQHDHVRIYGRDYGDRLEEAGFRVERVNHLARLGPAAAVRYGLPAQEDIYVCHKG